MPIPLIDLFAGPGGLGEGFSSLHGAEGSRSFRIRLSIEMDFWAHQTLSLRAFFRQFPQGQVPEAYYEVLKGQLTREELFEAHRMESEEALNEAWHAMLGAEHDVVDQRTHRKPMASGRARAIPPESPSEACIDAEIRRRLGPDINGHWGLIGGPPCQAYSLVGRSRMIGERGRAKFEKDHRHFLYRHYLRIIAVHQPSVFVMENVKGLLSAKVGEMSMFEQITGDLRNPRRALFGDDSPDGGYDLYPLPVPSSALAGMNPAPTDFIIHSERYGIPQCRHRVIILGVRRGLPAPKAISGVTFSGVENRHATLREVIGDLPPLRSGLSVLEDTTENWLAEIRSLGEAAWFRKGVAANDAVLKQMAETMGSLRQRVQRSASTRIKNGPERYAQWYIDSRHPELACNHATRSHITEDLHRYLYSSSFAEVHGRSPSLSEYPRQLLPAHRNVDQAVEGGMFGDRFRVQLRNSPATTITSHISKDGHYFIHPDGDQCRSFSVREAARVQTFPDNYFFAGPRTEQYHQVGNAVPPLLARQIALVVRDVLDRASARPHS